MSRCIGAIWHSGQRPASADCLRRPRPLFCHPARQDRSRSTDHGRRPSQQLQGPQDAEGRQQEPTPISASKAVEKEVGDLSRLPFSLRILLENLVRHEDGTTVKKDDIAAFADWVKNGGKSTKEINFRPARVLMQDFTGVPAVVDLAAMRDAMGKLGGDAKKINPLVPVDLVIDHSVIVDNFGNNARLRRQREARVRAQPRALPVPALGPDGVRQFPRRAAGHRHLPPGEPGVSCRRSCSSRRTARRRSLYPDTLVGTDSHTTMVNGLAVLGWGVGGIEAEAAMLGQPQPMVIPEVVGFKLTGKLQGRRHRHRPGAHRHADAAQEGRGQQVRRILRRRPRRPAARQPRHHRQHGAGIRRDLRLLPDRRDHAGLSQDHQPRRRRQARRGLCQEAGPVALQEVAGSGLHRHALARSRRRRAEPRRPEAPAGPRAARQSGASSSSPTWRRNSTARTTASASSARAPTTTSAMATW